MKILKIIASSLLSLSLVFAVPAQASILQPMTDTVNSGIVNSKMLASDMLSNTNLDATVVNGVVIFRGSVAAQAQVNELIRIGRSVSGIKGVDVSGVRVVP